MKIEAGKFYRNRRGERVGPMTENHVKSYPWFAGSHHSTYTKDGQLYGGEETAGDLIAEWHGVKPALPSLVVTRGGRAVEDQEQGIEDFKEACRRAAQPPAILDWSATASPAYAPLAAILQEAYDQAATGKGKERHANDRPFIDQPILEIGRMCGPGFDTGQSIKKQQEAMGMLARGEDDAAIRELLGAINYAAAAIILIRERKRA